jgi:hypothetical protein
VTPHEQFKRDNARMWELNPMMAAQFAVVWKALTGRDPAHGQQDDAQLVTHFHARIVAE